MKKFSVLLFLFFSISTYSQKVKWEHSLGGKNSEYLFDMLPTADYGFLLAGSTLSSSGGDLSTKRIGNYDGWLWKMKEGGKREWEMRIGGNGDDYLKSVAYTVKDGGLILGLTSTSGKEGFKTTDKIGIRDLWIVKLNAEREVIWQKTYGGLNQDELVKVVSLPKGDILVLANSNSFCSGNKKSTHYGGQDIWLLHLDKEGEVLWEKSFGGEYDDIAVDIIVTKDNGYLIGGYSNSGKTGNKESILYGSNDYWVIKLDQKGEVLWQKTYGGKENDQLTQLQEISDGNYMIYGISESESSDGKNSSRQSALDYWFLSLDAIGTPVQEYSYGYGEKNFLVSAKVDQDGDIMLGGTALEAVKEGIKVSYLGTLLNKEGEVTWEKTISSKGENILTKMITTRDRGYVFAGTSNGQSNYEKQKNNGQNDFWIVKVSNDKKEKENKRKENTKENIESRRIEAIPNPVYTYTNIIIPFEYSKGKLYVYDASGRLLFEKDIEYQTEPINMSSYPTGSYIVQIKTDTEKGSVNVIRK